MKITCDFEKIFTISRGNALPLGSSITPQGVNFAIFSKHATDVSLVLFARGEDEPIVEIPLDPKQHKTGDIWHICIRGIDPLKIRYGYKMDRIPNENPNIHRYNPNIILIDPYAKALSDGGVWGGDEDDKVKRRERRSIVYFEDEFDWEGDKPLNIPLSQTIIYELHVRGYTIHPSSNVYHKGTFLGLTEKIPYLKELGITAVELLPINEFEELDTDRINPITGERLLNFWGYHPINFFSPKASYAHNNSFGMQVREFKEMVKTFHKAGIEVILDIVFNHTAEGNEHGPTLSFRGIDNSVYYILTSKGEYTNYSGCGNTVNCNHPVVRDMILDVLRYWVMEMHVDGFRFDLASILGRGTDGSVLSNPPLLEAIAHDPILANTKLIAEAWDAAGLYQVGSFPAWGRWAEWNGKFRDDIRRFVKSDPGVVQSLAQRLLGSPDLYAKSNRTPYHSINFITSHDGFTLRDLVSYNQKHNIENGEDNKDGDDNNLSWNCGIEGETDDINVNRLRLKQQKNFATLLFLSNGTPMILAGDEFGRTQKGNNNAYCQDNEISWVDWRLLEKNSELFRFFKLLIRFRKNNPLLNFRDFHNKNAKNIIVTFHGIRLNEPDLSYESRSLAMEVRVNNNAKKDEITNLYLIANAYWEELEFELPYLGEDKEWGYIIDTALSYPNDILERPKRLIYQGSYIAKERSCVVLVNIQKD